MPPLVAVYLAVLAIEYRFGRTRAIAPMSDRWTALASHLACELELQPSVVRQTTRNAATTLTRFPVREAGQLDALARANVRDTPRAFGSAVAHAPRTSAPDRDRCSWHVCRSAHAADLIVKDITYDYLGWGWYRLARDAGQPHPGSLYLSPVWGIIGHR